MAFNSNPNPFSFGAPQNNKRPPQTSSSNLFSPAASTGNDSLFSSTSSMRSENPFESPVNPGRSAFAGHTPAKSAGGRSLFGANGQPSITFGHNGGAAANAGAGLFGKPRSRRGSRSSQEDIHIHEDSAETGRADEDEEPTDVDESYEDTGDADYSLERHQEDDDTGMYGDEEDYDDTLDNGDNELTPTKPRRGGEVEDEEEGIADRLLGPALEPGQLILKTEQLMEELAGRLAVTLNSDGESEYPSDVEMDGPQGVDPVVRAELLQKYSKQFIQALHQQSLKAKQSAQLMNAFKITALILTLRHSTASVPEVIRKWLYFEDPQPSSAELKAFKSFHPNPACFPDFWPLIHRLAIRGEIHEIVNIIEHSDWNTLASDEPATTNPILFQANNAKRYTREEVNAIRTAMGACLQVLKKTPGKGRNSYTPPLQFFPTPSTVDSPGTPAEWRIYRGNVARAADDLRASLAEHEDESYDDEDSYFAPNAGNGSSYGFSLSQSTGSRVKPPTEFSSGLLTLYSILEGKRSYIVAAADTFIEAVHALVYYCREVDDLNEDAEWYYTEIWNPNTQLEPHDLVNMRQQQRQEDLMRVSEELNRLIDTDDNDAGFAIDRSNDYEVTVAAVLADDPKVVGELSGFSPLAAATVVEIGGYSGWCERGSEKRREDTDSGVLGAFDEDDMAVFDLARDRGEKTEEEEAAEFNDDIVKEYAATLMGTEWIDKNSSVEGWEVAVGVLSRVTGGMEVAQKLLPQLPTTTPERTKKLLDHCLSTSALAPTASSIAYTYARSLPANPSTLGPRLTHLALAAPHLATASSSIHRIIQSLIRRSLTSHSSFPPTSSLDPDFANMLSNPASVDSETLRYELAGYATLRAWYETSHPRALIAVVRAAGEQIDEMAWDRDWRCNVEPRWVPCLIGQEVAGLLKGWKEGGLDEESVMEVARVLGDWEAVGDEVVKAVRDDDDEEGDDGDEKIGAVEVKEGWEARVRLAVAKALAGIWVAK